MSENHALCMGKQDFASYAVHYNVEYVVLECSERNKPLLTFLLGSPDWTPVQFDGWNILFARSSLNKPSVFKDFHVLEPIIADIKTGERRPAFSLNLVGNALYTLGFYDQAEMLFRDCLACDEGYFEAWSMLGAVLSVRGFQNLNLRNVNTGQRYLLAARQCFRQAVTLNPRYHPAKESLKRLEEKLSEIGR
jgi:tetratricopeptide (TPR) repeat protein